MYSYYVFGIVKINLSRCTACMHAKAKCKRTSIIASFLRIILYNIAQMYSTPATLGLPALLTSFLHV